MLEAKEVESGYGGVAVLKDLDFSVGDEVFAVLGANGAGKTTLMKTLARLLPLNKGRLEFKDKDISSLAAHHLPGLGLAYVPQENNVFPDLTVAENLSLGSLVGKRPKQELLAEVVDLFPTVGNRINQRAGTLSGGESQMVAVGRTLMQEPDLILLDEPTAGLSPQYVDVLFEMIRRIHDTRGISVVIAEQNATRALEVSDRVMVLRLGTVFLSEAVEDVDVEQLKEGYGISDTTDNSIGSDQGERA